MLYRGVELREVAPRFFYYVSVSLDENACWLWSGAKSKGYGQFQLADKIQVRAHRVAFFMHYGELDDALTVDHVCHDAAVCAGGSTCPHRACQNWRHLEQRDRGTNARRSLLLTTTCKSGRHPWTEENIVRRPSRPSTSGECRACARETQRRRSRT